MLARLITRWQGVVQPRKGLDALLDVIENLQGAALPASILETEILPARIRGYRPADLDTLIAAGEVTWVGFDAHRRAGWAGWAVPGGEAGSIVGAGFEVRGVRSRAEAEPTRSEARLLSI